MRCSHKNCICPRYRSLNDVDWPLEIVDIVPPDSRFVTPIVTRLGVFCGATVVVLVGNRKSSNAFGLLSGGVNPRKSDCLPRELYCGGTVVSFVANPASLMRLRVAFVNIVISFRIDPTASVPGKADSKRLALPSRCHKRTFNAEFSIGSRPSYSSKPLSVSSTENLSRQLANSSLRRTDGNGIAISPDCSFLTWSLSYR